MRLDCITCCFAAIVIGCLTSNAVAQGEKKVVIPFDFQSKFDDGRYGQIVGDIIWKRLDREGGFIVPETMLDVRDFCESNHVKMSPEMDMAKVRKIVKDDFGAQIAIWGSVERVPGHDWDVYDFSIMCVDFSVTPNKVIYEKKNVRTKTVSEIPHVYVKEMLEKLYGRTPDGPRPKDTIEEENWKNNPSLVVGDFEKGRGRAPNGWEKVGGHDRRPLGNVVKWIPEAGNKSNHVIRFTFSKLVGDTTGVLYYSDFFPVEEGAKYRFQCRWRTNGPSVKVFIKCYDSMGSEYTKNQARRSSGNSGRLKKNAYVPEASQRREVYRSQQNLKGTKNAWHTQTEDFTPKHTKYTPQWGRVMLYAYIDAGVVEFDDVVIKQIMPASPSEGIKSRRHSSSSGVTIKQMEENERRGQEDR